MKLELLELDLENFKSYRKFTFSPAGRSMDVFGRNHAGKTPLADSYFWLLFGRDTLGKSDSHILPEDENGAPIEGLNASVAGTFRKNNGEEFTLQRVYKQKFSRKKGDAERSAAGNTTDFFINGVPKSKTDYQAFVAGICDEKTFAMLTDPDMFPGKMGWKERREFLIKSFATDIDDREIINAHADLKSLGQYIGYKSVADYAAQTDYERKKTQKEKDEIPGKIEATERAKPADLPKDEDAHNAVTLSKSKIQLEQQISAVRNGQAEADLRRQISEIQAQIADAKAEYTRKNMAGNSGAEAEATKLRSQINNVVSHINQLENPTIPGIIANISGLNNEIAELRQKWIDTDAQEFDPSNNICPTCGQEYPAEKQEQIQGDFNDNKARTLEKLESDASAKKDELKKAQADLDVEKRNLEKRSSSLADLKSRLDNLTAQIVHPAPFEETKEYAALDKNLKSAQAQLKSISGASEQRVAMLQEQLSGVNGELDSIRERAANKKTADHDDELIEGYKAREKELAGFLAIYATGLNLAEKFELQKAQDIEEKVNSEFRTVRWKLFDHLQNGGNEPCCEAYVQTPHGLRGYNRGAGFSERVNAGLDIINTLSRVIGISVPLWIDNAGETTDFEPVNTQVFRLYVSADDKTIRVEPADMDFEGNPDSADDLPVSDSVEYEQEKLI